MMNSRKNISETYDVIHDNSLRDSISSNDSEYVMRKIREDYITGSSCTIYVEIIHRQENL